MSLFSFLRGNAEQSVMLIDIGSSSVAGAFVRIDKKCNPVIHYAVRIPISSRKDVGTLSDMERALAELTKTLSKSGAPAFAHAVGSGKIDRIFVSVASPWQKTSVRVKQIHRSAPFRFTRHFMNDIVTKSVPMVPNYTHTNELVISTILNGYEVTRPFGKMTREANIVILSCFIANGATEKIRTALRSTFHTHEIEFTTFTPVAYLVLRDIYPHQKNFLIIDVTGESTDLMLVRHGLLVESVSTPCGLGFLRRAAIEAGISTSTAEPLRAVEEAILIDTKHNEHFTKHMQEASVQWAKTLASAFQSLTTNYALPHTAFLLADKSVSSFLKQLLNETNFHSAWLSNEPLSVISIGPDKLTHCVTYHNDAYGDVFLSILALYIARKYPIPSENNTAHILTSDV